MGYYRISTFSFGWLASFSTGASFWFLFQSRFLTKFLVSLNWEKSAWFWVRFSPTFGSSLCWTILTFLDSMYSSEFYSLDSENYYMFFLNFIFMTLYTYSIYWTDLVLNLWNLLTYTFSFLLCLLQNGLVLSLSVVCKPVLDLFLVESSSPHEV